MPAWRKLAALVSGLAVAALIGAYAIALTAPAVGVFHDDGVYLVTAKSLATGRGYNIVSLPRATPETKYPILFPALLAAVWRIAPPFPGNVMWLKCVPLLAGVIWLGLSFCLLKRETGSGPIAGILVGLAALSPWTLFLSTALLSETVFAAFTTGAVMAVERACSAGRHARMLVPGAAILASAAFLTRTAGVAVFTAGALTLGCRVGVRKSALYLAVCAALCAPWLAWQAAQKPAVAGVSAFDTVRNYETWNVIGGFTWSQKPVIVGVNLASFLVAPGILMGFPARTAGALGAIVLGVLALIGLAHRLRTAWGALEWLVVIYGSMLMLWAWPPTRFLAPLLPAMLLYAYLGARQACRWPGLTPRAGALVMAALALLLAAQSGRALAHSVGEVAGKGRVGVPNLDLDDWAETGRLLAWIDEHTPAAAVVMGNIDPIVYLFTGRHALRGFRQDPYLLHYSLDPAARPLGDAPEWMASAAEQAVDYVVLTPDTFYKEAPYLRRLYAEVVAADPGLLTQVYEGGDARYRVYARAGGERLRRFPAVSKR
ncbi:MAG: hypothetical protein HYX26_08680 [Acidobacteriales bacterium]|nr:hypothetical protein [Terriglobales bacterium]